MKTVIFPAECEYRAQSESSRNMLSRSIGCCGRVKISPTDPKQNMFMFLPPCKVYQTGNSEAKVRTARKMKTMKRPAKDCCLHAAQAGNLKLLLSYFRAESNPPTVFGILISNWLVTLTKRMSLNTQEQGPIPPPPPPSILLNTSLPVPTLKSKPSNKR
jgi:hypothetical protein